MPNPYPYLDPFFSLGSSASVSTYANLATSLSRPYTTIYNQSIILPESDDQVIEFSPKTTDEDEDASGADYEFYISDSENGNSNPTTLTVGDGIEVIDDQKPTIQVTLPDGITSMTAYALVQILPSRRTLAQGTLIVRQTAAG